MKKLLYVLAAATFIAGCTKTAEIAETVARTGDADLIPATIYATIENTADTSRVHLDGVKTLWNNGDIIRMVWFSRGRTDSTSYEFKFSGEDNAACGQFEYDLDHIPESTNDLSALTRNGVYALYPRIKNHVQYAVSDYCLATEIPIEQKYIADTGTAQPQVSLVSDFCPFRDSGFRYNSATLHFRHMASYMVLRLWDKTGTKISSIMVGANGNEFIAGAVKVQLDGDEPVATPDYNIGTISDYVTLNTGNIALSTDPANPTEFFIAMAPTVLSKGFTITVTDEDGKIFTQSTAERAYDMKRGQVLSMPAVEAKFHIPDNEIWLYGTETVNMDRIRIINGMGTVANFGANYTRFIQNNDKRYVRLVFDGNITKLKPQTINTCYSVVTLLLPRTLKMVYNMAMKEFTKLETVDFPATLTDFEKYPFGATVPASWKRINLRSVTPPYVQGQAGNLDQLGLPESGTATDLRIYVPAQSVEAYRSTFPWSKHADIIVGCEFDD